ncbi:MAG: acyl carrier protein [Actinobacteria bacterium]|nr:acyl carrier protein [Actinomycetota bacterium]
MKEVGRRVRQFVETEIRGEAEGDPLRWEDETPLLGSYLDSLGLMQLIDFLEQEYGLEFDDDDLRAEHFSTVSRIEALVDRKLVKR